MFEAAIYRRRQQSNIEFGKKIDSEPTICSLRIIYSEFVIHIVHQKSALVNIDIVKSWIE